MIFILNAINLVTVLVGFVVQVLIVRFFGASDATDIYYLILAITTFITGLSTGFLTDLFIPIYNDAKNRGHEHATRLTGGVMTLSLLSGVVLTIIIYALAPVFISIFASGFHASEFRQAVSMLRIVSFSIIFTSMSMILNATLNANSFLLITYLTNLITPIFNVCALFVWGARYGVAALMYAMVFASMAIFLIVFAYCKFKIGARFANPLGQKDLKYLLKKNIPVRTARIAQMFRGPLTTTVLSYFPSGFLTLYSYADKIITVILGTTGTPLAQIFYIKASEFSSKRNFADIKSLLVETIRSSIILFAGMFFVTALAFQRAFGVLFTGKVPPGGVETMFLLFLSLFPFYYLSLLTTQLGMTALSMKKGRFIFYVSVTFVAIFGLSLLPLVHLLSVYGLPIGLSIGQASALALIIVLVNRLYPIVSLEFLRVQLTTVCIAILLILTSVLLVKSAAILTGLSVLLFSTWIILSGKSALNAMRFITTKGEIR